MSPDLPAVLAESGGRLRRHRRRGACSVDAGLVARRAWHRRSLGIQPVGPCWDIHGANYEGIRFWASKATNLALPIFLPTFIVPLFVITHVTCAFWLLLRNENGAGRGRGGPPRRSVKIDHNESAACFLVFVAPGQLRLLARDVLIAQPFSRTPLWIVKVSLSESTARVTLGG